ncbi:MAG: SWIM zinc finger family protein [Gammaproteobacteria bacterium]
MISLQKIEALAPDQASLAAARKLLDNKKWPLSEIASDGRFIWGECQGSGSAPYRACVALVDLGYKCTCPSRKFPCKHSLALMWRFQQNPNEFSESVVPPWVLDWSSKRRGSVPPSASASPSPEKDISSALINDAPEKPLKDSLRADKTRERNLQQREASIQAGLDDFIRWLQDVFDRGLLAFMQNCSTGCRQAAKRLVDAKAAGLASQLDELASDVLLIPEPQRPRYLHQQLASLYLLACAYQKQQQLPDTLRQDVRRSIGWTISRDQLLEMPEAARITGSWQVLAVREYLQNDGLRRLETWLGLTEPENAGIQFAVLIDYHHVSAGTVAPPFVGGEGLAGTVVYFPSATPLRGILVDYQRAENVTDPACGLSLADALADRLIRRQQNPWLPNWPLAVCNPEVFVDDSGEFWMTDNGISLPIKHPNNAALFALIGLPIKRATLTWDGWRADLLHADTAIGFWSAAS